MCDILAHIEMTYCDKVTHIFWQDQPPCANYLQLSQN